MEKHTPPLNEKSGEATVRRSAPTVRSCWRPSDSLPHRPRVQEALSPATAPETGFLSLTATNLSTVQWVGRRLWSRENLVPSSALLSCVSFGQLLNVSELHSVFSRGSWGYDATVCRWGWLIMEVNGVAPNWTSGSGMNGSHGGSNHPPGMARNQPHSYHPAFDDSWASLIQQIAGCFLGGPGRGLLKILDQAQAGEAEGGESGWARPQLRRAKSSPIPGKLQGMFSHVLGETCTTSRVGTYLLFTEQDPGAQEGSLGSWTPGTPCTIPHLAGSR